MVICLQIIFMKSRPENDQQQTAQCVYSIPCECVKSYIGETSRSLAAWLREHMHNFEEGILEISKLSQHV
jgi:hypothetical protein